MKNSVENTLETQFQCFPEWVEMMNQKKDLYKVFTQAIIDKGAAQSRAEVKKQPYFDLTELAPQLFCEPSQDAQEVLLSLEEDFWKLVPPYAKGTIRISSEQYFTWETENVDPENETCSIFLTSYTWQKIHGMTTWVPNYRRRVLIGRIGNKVQIRVEERVDAFTHVIRALTLDDFSRYTTLKNAFDGTENSLKSVLQRLSYQLERIADTIESTLYNSTDAAILIGVINAYLQLENNRRRKINKKTAQSAEECSAPKPIDTAAAPASNAPHILSLDSLLAELKSKERAKKKGIQPNYVTTSWVVSGYFRANGTYVKPTTAHRHCLKDNEPPKARKFVLK